MAAVTALCEYCQERWTVESDTAPELMEGICPVCQPERDVEMPLDFMVPLDSDIDLPELPKDCLADEY